MSVVCPNCGTRLRAPPTAAGMQLPCPRCSRMVSIPAQGDAAPTPTPTPTQPPAIQLAAVHATQQASASRAPAPRSSAGKTPAPKAPESKTPLQHSPSRAQYRHGGGGGCLLVVAVLFFLVAIAGVLVLLLGRGAH